MISLLILRIWSGSSCAESPFNPPCSSCQIDLGFDRLVRRIATRGQQTKNSSNYVKAFKLQSSTDGRTWHTFKQNNTSHLDKVGVEMKKKNVNLVPDMWLYHCFRCCASFLLFFLCHSIFWSYRRESFYLFSWYVMNVCTTLFYFATVNWNKIFMCSLVIMTLLFSKVFICLVWNV